MLFDSIPTFWGRLTNSKSPPSSYYFLVHWKPFGIVWKKKLPNSIENGTSLYQLSTMLHSDKRRENWEKILITSLIYAVAAMRKLLQLLIGSLCMRNRNSQSIVVLVWVLLLSDTLSTTKFLVQRSPTESGIAHKRSVSGKSGKGEGSHGNCAISLMHIDCKMLRQYRSATVCEQGSNQP